MTGWMLCILSHIREDVFKNAQNYHHIQVNTVIKSFFSGSWGVVKTIKPGKISDISSDISDNQITLYTSACIEEERTGRNLSHTDSKDGSHSHYWNVEYHAFDCQFRPMGC